MSTSTFPDADRWMDHEENKPTGPFVFRGFIDPALQLPKRFLGFITTSPGLLTLVTTCVVLAILAAGGASALSSTWRQGDLAALVTRTEPLSNSSQELYNNLSVADSAAATGFLDNGRRLTEPNQRAADTYDQAVTSAARNLVQATSGINDIQSREMQLVLQIQTILPEYVDLIAQARANDRVRNPVGAAYLEQASAMMQDKMLPAAQELYTLTSSEVSHQQNRVVSPLWFPISGLAAAVIMLLLAQLWLFALTNRRFNLGFLLATVLMVVALLWTAVASIISWNAGTRGVDQAMVPLQQLTQQRITAQQARTGEALGLVQRDYRSPTQEQFSEQIRHIDQALDGIRSQVAEPQRVDRARELIRDWDQAHAHMLLEIQEGDYTTAVQRLSTGDEFGALDTELRELIEQSRQQLRNVLVSGQHLARTTALAVFVLTLFAAACTIAGSRPRLQEYL